MEHYWLKIIFVINTFVNLSQVLLDADMSSRFVNRHI